MTHPVNQTPPGSQPFRFPSGGNLPGLLLSTMLRTFRPFAAAQISGGAKYPNVNGRVDFFETAKGVLVSAWIRGLPQTQNPCASPIFGFHIHAGDRCAGNAEDEFADALGHFNPDDCKHPYHA